MESSAIRRQRTLCAPIYLHYQHKKFWEIKLNGTLFSSLLSKQNLSSIVRTCQTTLRVGKLLDNDQEDPESIQEVEKVHEDLGSLPIK